MTLQELITPAAVAAVVAALTSVLLGVHKAAREDRERRRKMFADAFGVYMAYREFPFVIRRRRADKPADERARIGEEIRQIQQQLGYFIGWTKLEDTEVGEAFSKLIASLRDTAGREMHRAWADSKAVADDADMNITDVNLDASSALEEAYLEAVRQHLKPWRSLFSRSPGRVPGASAPDPRCLSSPDETKGE